MQANTAVDVDRLMYRISHDLGASVRALVELPVWINEDLSAAKIDVPEDVRENLEAMSVNGNRLDRMINDLLMYSRIGRFQNIENVDAKAVVAEIMETLPLPAGISLKQDITDQKFLFPQPDFARLCYAFLSNSIKHRDHNTTEIKISIAVHGEEVIVSVQDNGPGILPKYRPKALEMLSTLQSRDEVDGSGMGLAIAEKIAHSSGGSLLLAGNPGGPGLRAVATLGIAKEGDETPKSSLSLTKC